MRLYGLKNCDICQKARKSLKDNGMEVEFVDVRAQGISKEDLDRFLDAFGNELLNRRSLTWRNLDTQQRQNDPLTLLMAHPALMKRPVIDHEGELFLGWGPEVQNILLGRGKSFRSG